LTIGKDRKVSIRYWRTGHLWIAVTAKSTKTGRIELTKGIPWFTAFELRRFSADGLGSTGLPCAICQTCLQRGEVTPAAVADHTVPHKSD
jgi:hypothetical protein